MHKPLFLAATLSLLAAAPAHAETWYELAATGDAIGYGDADTIASHDGETSLQVLLGLREALGAEENIEFLVSEVRFSCSDGRYRVERVSGLDGERAEIAEIPGSREWKQVSEGTLYASFRDFACAARSARAVVDPYRATAEFWRPDEELLESATIELAGQFYVG